MGEMQATHALLSDIVKHASYRPGYRLYLEEHDGVLCLCVLAKGYDSYHPERGETYRVLHTFQVPPASYNEASWKRWILEQLIKLETHEACEFFRIVRDSALVERPFAPNHGPGWDPYTVRELNRVEHAETTFRGERREGTQ